MPAPSGSTTPPPSEDGAGRPAAGAVLVLADPDDVGAVAVAGATAARVRARVAVLWPTQLGTARWNHRVSPAGVASTELVLADGRRFGDADVAAVLVRSEQTAVPRFARSSPADRTYAAAELRALVASWLRSLGSRVLNRGDGVGLTGPSWSSTRWLIEAARAGLPVASRTAATSARLVPGWDGSPYDARRPYRDVAPTAPLGGAVVAGGRFAGPAGAEAERSGAACRRLAAASGCQVVYLSFGAGLSGAATVTEVGAVPPLASAAEVDAVADLLAATVAAAGHG